MITTENGRLAMIGPQTTLPGVYGLGRGDKVRVRRCRAVNGPYLVSWAMDAPVFVEGQCLVRVVGAGLVAVELVVKIFGADEVSGERRAA